MSTKNTITKENIKNLILEYVAASEKCREIERAARDARGAADEFKAQLLGLSKLGVPLKSGKIQATITETQRDGYFVKPSTRVTVSVVGVND